MFPMLYDSTNLLQNLKIKNDNLFQLIFWNLKMVFHRLEQKISRYDWLFENKLDNELIIPKLKIKA